MDKEKKRGKRTAIGSSLLISGLTRFSTWVYASILAGVFGLIFTSYKKIRDGFRSSFLLTKLHTFFKSLKEPKI